MLVIGNYPNLWKNLNYGGRGCKYPFLGKGIFFMIFITAWTIALLNWEQKDTKVTEKFQVVKELEEVKWTYYSENEDFRGDSWPFLPHFNLLWSISTHECLNQCQKWISCIKFMRNSDVEWQNRHHPTYFMNFTDILVYGNFNSKWPPNEPHGTFFFLGNMQIL